MPEKSGTAKAWRGKSLVAGGKWQVATRNQTSDQEDFKNRKLRSHQFPAYCFCFDVFVKRCTGEVRFSTTRQFFSTIYQMFHFRKRVVNGIFSFSHVTQLSPDQKMSLIFLAILKLSFGESGKSLQSSQFAILFFTASHSWIPFSFPATHLLVSNTHTHFDVLNALHCTMKATIDSCLIVFFAFFSKFSHSLKTCKHRTYAQTD